MSAMIIAPRNAKVYPASDKQRKYILDMLANRDLTGTAYDGWTPDWTHATSQNVSGVIKFLQALPYRTERPAATAAPAIPAGRYAVDLGEGLRFFKINTGKDGTKWAGYVFVDAMASDTLYPVKGARRLAVLEAIGADVAGAAGAYGREIKKCGFCHRTLTDTDAGKSTERGYGPDCAEKHGLPWG